MEIRVYDSNLSLLGFVDNSTSLLWNRRFYKPGAFELHLPATDSNLELLTEGNLVHIYGKKEAGIIEHKDIENDNLVVSGNFLSNYMDRRLIKGTFNFDGLTEVAMRDILTNATAIPNVELGTLNGFTPRVQFQATYKNLLAYEEKLSVSSNIGFRFRPNFENKKIIFETYEGVDRTSGQAVNSRVEFSENYKNIANPKYSYDDSNLRTIAYVGGEGEGSARTFVTVGGGSGLGLRELFVDAKDIQKGDLTDDQYKALLVQRGNEKLAENIINESFDADALPDINFVYAQDYDLGDIVTIKEKKWNKSMDKRITEIQEVYEHTNMFIRLTFGDPLPETIDWSDS